MNRGQYVLKLVKRDGYTILAVCDGCYCGRFQVAGIDVTVACHKGSRFRHSKEGPTIHVNFLGDDEPELQKECQAIGEEIAKQLRDSTCLPAIICLKPERKCARKAFYA